MDLSKNVRWEFVGAQTENEESWIDMHRKRKLLGFHGRILEFGLSDIWLDAYSFGGKHFRVRRRLSPWYI